MVTDDELRQIMPNLKADRRALMLPFIQQAMQEFDITTYLREAAFLAQLAHESAELRYMEEIASGAAYEGRRDLGNTQPGDGKRFKGRGPIQLTGRANYKRYGDLLGLDLIDNPTQAATPEVGFRIAGLFWKSNGLNQLADQQDFRTITKRINGGFNGLDDRLKYYDRAKRVLSRGDEPPAATPASVLDAVTSAAESAFAGIDAGAGGGTRGFGAGDTGGDGPGFAAPTTTTRSIPPNLSRGILPAQEEARAAGAAKKSSGKKAAGKKTAGKKTASQTAAGQKSASKKAAGQKGSSGKGAGKKISSKKTSSKKGGAKKGGGSKKGAGKKGTAGRGGARRGAAKKGGARRRG